jgi:hypothetical protein
VENLVQGTIPDLVPGVTTLDAKNHAKLNQNLWTIIRVFFPKNPPNIARIVALPVLTKKCLVEGEVWPTRAQKLQSS